MTVQEAKIKQVEITKQILELSCSKGVDVGVAAFFEVLSESLEKRIPKKPKKKLELVPKHSRKGIYEYYCPICSRDLLDQDNYYFMYCPDCGQALYWGDEE